MGDGKIVSPVKEHPFILTSKEHQVFWMKIKLEDNEQKRAWGETSGAVEHVSRKIGSPVIKPELVQKLIKKNIIPAEDGEHYSRDIGGVMHTKLAVGHPKI